MHLIAKRGIGTIWHLKSLEIALKVDESYPPKFFQTLPQGQQKK